MSAAFKPVAETFSFDGESVGPAGAAALRKVKFLAEAAPQGRLFSAISTLADNAGLAAAEYEAASLAMLRNEVEAAESHLKRGTRMTRRLKENAKVEAAVPLPAFMRYR
jgi:thioredoxin-like negative regulator of GroEL